MLMRLKISLWLQKKLNTWTEAKLSSFPNWMAAVVVVAETFHPPFTRCFSLSSIWKSIALYWSGIFFIFFLPASVQSAPQHKVFTESLCLLFNNWPLTLNRSRKLWDKNIAISSRKNKRKFIEGGGGWRWKGAKVSLKPIWVSHWWQLSQTWRGIKTKDDAVHRGGPLRGAACTGEFLMEFNAASCAPAWPQVWSLV